MQKQQMKKIKYGNRDKTKEKRNMFIQGLKEGDDDVCGAVLDSFSEDYLSYITGLVKASKTPSKMRTQQRIQGLFQGNTNKQKNKLLNQQPVNVVNDTKSKQVSPKSPKSYSEIKNSTLPMKNIKGLIQASQAGQNRKHRDKSFGSAFQNVDKYNQLKIDRNFANKQYYNRFPTQQAQKSFKEQKFDQTSIVISQQSDRRMRNNEPRKQFLEGLNEYLVTLQSHRPLKKSQMRKNSGKSKIIDQQIRNVQELLQQNIRLRRKVRKYEQIKIQIEQNMENHFIHCKRQQKSQKTKINDLTKALLRAISKVNQQKQQIDSMKYQLKSFGRKAQYCAQKYEQQSSGEQQIHESLLKVMRPSRATSQYKLKKKVDIPYLHFMNKGD